MGKRAPSAKRMNLLYSNDTQGNYPESWYSATAKQLNVFPSLKGTQKYDICIVGAGYTGLSTALHLSNLGYSVACLLYTSPSPRDHQPSRMPSSA